MTLGIRKLTVLGMVGVIVMVANAVAVARWLHETGVIESARDIRDEFLTGTAITVIVALLILLSGPDNSRLSRRCPVCDHRISHGARYCPDCGSRV